MAEDILTKTFETFVVELVNITKGFKFYCDICKKEHTCHVASIKYKDQEYPLTFNYNKFIIPNIPVPLEGNKYFIKSDMWVCCDECTKTIQNYIDSLVSNKQDIKN